MPAKIVGLSGPMRLLCVQGRGIASMRFWGWGKWCRDGIQAWQRVAILAKKDGVARFMQKYCYLCNG